MALPKTYFVVARLGWRSDTGDRDGTLEHTGRVPASPQLPTGSLMQAPPAFSAVRVDGERAYLRARRGEEVAPDARPVTVHRAELRWLEGDRAGFEVEVSSGTYIRSLVADLEDAYCEELQRTAVGDFRVEDADPERTIPLEEALAFLPERPLSETEAIDVSHGRMLSGAADHEAVRLTRDERLLAIGEPKEGALHPSVVFRPA